MWGSMETYDMKFFGECCEWVYKYDGQLLVQCDRIPCLLLVKFEQLEMRSLQYVWCRVIGVGNVFRLR